MGGNRRRQEYIHDFARNLMGIIGIKDLDYQSYKTRQDLARALCKDHWTTVIGHLSRDQSDATCGKLAACGLGQDIHHKAEHRSKDAFTLLEIVGTEHPWLDLDYSGRLIVSRTATAAVLAAMADNIWSVLKRLRQETDVIVEEADWELKPFTFRTPDKALLVKLANESGTTVSVVVREAIDRFLAEERAKQTA